MLIRGCLEKWKMSKHGPRIQAKAIAFIASKIEIQLTCGIFWLLVQADVTCTIEDESSLLNNIDS